MGKQTVTFEVVGGVAGPSLHILDPKPKRKGTYRTGRRISGPKAWGGGTLMYEFEVDLDELESQLAKYKKPTPTPTKGRK